MVSAGTAETVSPGNDSGAMDLPVPAAGAA
jgi:hypothetical protein